MRDAGILLLYEKNKDKDKRFSFVLEAIARLHVSEERKKKIIFILLKYLKCPLLILLYLTIDGNRIGNFCSISNMCEHDHMSAVLHL